MCKVLKSAVRQKTAKLVTTLPMQRQPGCPKSEGSVKQGKERRDRIGSALPRRRRGGFRRGVLLLPSTHGGIFARKSSEVNVQNVIFFTSFLFGKNMIQPFFGRSPGLLLLLLLTRAKKILLEKQKGEGTTFSPFLPRLRLGEKV